MRIIADNEPTAALRVVPLTIVDDTANAAPWAGSVTGVKAELSVNGGAEVDSTADIVRVAGSLHTVALTQAEVNRTPGDVLTIRVPAASGRREALTAVVIGPAGTYDPIVTDASVATAVDTALADNFAAIPAAVETQLANEFAAIPGAVVTALAAASDGRAFGATSQPAGGSTVALQVRNAGGAVVGSRNAFYNSAGQLVGLTAVA